MILLQCTGTDGSYTCGKHLTMYVVQLKLMLTLCSNYTQKKSKVLQVVPCVSLNDVILWLLWI